MSVELAPVDLEQLFHADEAGCESMHRAPDNRYCAGAATFLSRTLCRGPKRVCAAHAARVMRLLVETPMNRCHECVQSGVERTIADCWKVIPI